MDSIDILNIFAIKYLIKSYTPPMKKLYALIYTYVLFLGICTMRNCTKTEINDSISVANKLPIDSSMSVQTCLFHRSWLFPTNYTRRWHGANNK